MSDEEEVEENPIDKYERQPKEEENTKRWDTQGPEGP